MHLYGYKSSETVADVLLLQRRRHHYMVIMNKIEAEIEEVRAWWKADEHDIHVWQRKSGYKQLLLMMETCKILRTEQSCCDWAVGIWFGNATPRYAFISRVTMHNRLFTCDRMTHWNQNSSVGCALYQTPLETRDNLFFSFIYSFQVWSGLMSGILLGQFSTDWTAVTTLF